MITRRALIAGGLAWACTPGQAGAVSRAERALVLAPSSLGLRPNPDGGEPGAWRAPAVLVEAGLASRLSPTATSWLARPAYARGGEPGTRIRNGAAIRRFSVDLAAPVAGALTRAQFPVVIGGDCSILLGCLLGARRAGGRVGLVHVDGHSDFFHPGNYDVHGRLGSAAGMDLALATGRGEPLLTTWPGVDGPLVVDADAAQLGERDALSPEYDRSYGDIKATAVTRVLVQDLLRDGIAATVDRMAEWFHERALAHVWLHVDLARLVAGLTRTGRVVGADFTIYDPDRDPGRRYARQVVDCIVRGLA